MRHHVEFHDSTIESIVREGTSLRLNMEAYVHRWEMVAGKWKGTGLGQRVQITIESPTFQPPPKLPAELNGGGIRIGEVTHDNLVPLPFAAEGSVVLNLEFKTEGMLEVHGESITIDSKGEGSYIEDLPDEFKPADAS